MPRGDGQRQGQPGAVGPDGVLPRPDQAQHGQGKEEDGRGVLPQGLARGPDARPQREDPRREHGLLHRAPAAHGQEDHARGQAREERRGRLAHEGRPRLVQGEEGTRQREERRREHGREHGVDRDAMGPDRAGERVLDLRVLVEVEVRLLDEAGRDALRRPRVPGADGPAVRHQQDEDGQHDAGRSQQGRRHDARRALERLLPRPDAHQRTGCCGLGRTRLGCLRLGPGGLGIVGLAIARGLALGLGLRPGLALGVGPGLGPAVELALAPGDAGGGVPWCF